MFQQYEVTQIQVLLFALFLLAFFCALIVYFIISLLRDRAHLTSPYTGGPMMRADLLPWESKKKIVLFLKKNGRFINRPFRFSKALVCRQTGRVFPGSINFFGLPSLDWNFIQNRCKGSFVSWGSLSKEQQDFVKDKHSSLNGFQLEFSSARPLPRELEKEFAWTKPGPLYVDVKTYTLLGWQQIPDTELEVLIVQMPELPAGRHDSLQKSRSKQKRNPKGVK